MIKVILGDNLQRKSIFIDESTKLKEAIKQTDVDYSRGTTHLDGCSLSSGDMDKSFLELGVTGSQCFLLNVIKADNA